MKRVSLACMDKDSGSHMTIIVMSSDWTYTLNIANPFGQLVERIQGSDVINQYDTLETNKQTN